MNYDFEESGKRDHVNINDFDVLNRISSIINSEFGSNDAAIARYLIAHIRRSSEINVATITRDAFVTRSAVRRFCNRLGYQSLSDLKESFTQSVLLLFILQVQLTTLFQQHTHMKKRSKSLTI